MRPERRDCSSTAQASPLAPAKSDKLASASRVAPRYVATLRSPLTILKLRMVRPRFSPRLITVSWLRL